MLFPLGPSYDDGYSWDRIGVVERLAKDALRGRADRSIKRGTAAAEETGDVRRRLAVGKHLFRRLSLRWRERRPLADPFGAVGYGFLACTLFFCWRREFATFDIRVLALPAA